VCIYATYIHTHIHTHTWCAYMYDPNVCVNMYHPGVDICRVVAGLVGNDYFHRKLLFTEEIIIMCAVAGKELGQHDHCIQSSSPLDGRDNVPCACCRNLPTRTYVFLLFSPRAFCFLGGDFASFCGNKQKP